MQLADIARPLIAAQQVERFIGDAEAAQSRLVGQAGQKMARESRNVASPVTQRRNGQLDDIHLIIEIFAEIVFFDFFLQLAVGRSNDSDIELETVRTA